uniref:Nuclear receptor 2C2-associated protein n=1 Tax=Leptobrachium leishanense TaxID=445787 RepID=A0A8C5QES7_9ANUR
MDNHCRVSSVLQRDVKQFGKQFLFDKNEDTCWNSDQGSSQWITIEFPQNVWVSQIHIQFQGGFSSKACILEGCQKDEEFVKIADFYPEDTNAHQRFTFSEQSVHKLKITFTNSTDLFGRIIVYHLDLHGHK